MAISLPSFSLIYALLLLFPGFISYKIARNVGKVTADVDRFDKITYTVIGSGISFSIIIVTYSYYTAFQIENLQDAQFSVAEISGGYLLMILTALLVGLIVGIVINHGVNRGIDVRSESTWQIISEGREEPAKVRAVMNNGSEIWGEIFVSDSDPHGQDLLLQYPVMIVRNDNGNVKNTLSIGEYVFLSQSGISHIYYETEISVSRS